MKRMRLKVHSICISTHSNQHVAFMQIWFNFFCVYSCHRRKERTKTEGGRNLLVFVCSIFFVASFSRRVVSFSFRISKRKLPLLIVKCSWRDRCLWIWLVRKTACDKPCTAVSYFGFLFRSCKFHICIFPRPQIAHSANISQVCAGAYECVCVCVLAHVTSTFHTWYANMNGWISYVCFLFCLSSIQLK